jgi:6-phosphogluconolactonase (cycloisomerase 2 family)
MLLALGALAASASANERSLYATQQWSDQGVQWFSMNVETGALTLNGPITPSGDTPAVPGITPDGQKLYVPAYNDDEIHAFSIGAGAPAEISGSPFATGDSPNAAIPSTSGSALWAADYVGGTVSGFGIGGSGALTAALGSPFATAGNPTTVAVSPRSPYLYTPDLSGQAINGYSTGPGGVLTPLGGFPLTDVGYPIDAEFSVFGDTLFVLNYNQTISSFSINSSTGALTEVPGSPFSFTGTAPSALAASPDGKFLFVGDSTDGSLQSFAIGTGGSLVPIDSVSPGGPIYDVTVSPNSRFVYSTDYSSGSIHGFSIDSDGSLDELASSPYGDQSGPIFSFAIVPDQGPKAAFSASANVSNVSVDATGSSDPDGTVAKYTWDFGDGSPKVTTSSPQSQHVYNRGGDFVISLVVTDNENCADQQIGTGQTLACNGSDAARAVQTVSIPALKLAYTSGRQVQKSGKVPKIMVQFFLNRDANVTYQFQKSLLSGACRKKTVTHKHSPKFKSYGKSRTYPQTNGLDQRTFVNKIGGKKIVPGRYRFKLRAKDAAGEQTGTITSASFCVT